MPATAARFPITLEATAGSLVPVTILTAIPICQFGLSAGCAAAILLFACLLVHELGHIVVATCKGVRVKALGFSVLGPYIRRRRCETAADEFWVSLAGPAFSLAAAIAMWELGVLGRWVGALNLVLALSNLLPMRGSDGWRALRAAKRCLSN